MAPHAWANGSPGPGMWGAGGRRAPQVQGHGHMLPSPGSRGGHTSNTLVQTGAQKGRVRFVSRARLDRQGTSLWDGEGVGCFEEKVGHCLEVYSCDIAPQGHRGQGRKLLGQPTATSALRTGRTQRRFQGKEVKRTEKCLSEHVQCLRNQVWGFNTSPLLILAAAQSRQYCSVDNRTTMTPTPRAPFKSAAYLFSSGMLPHGRPGPIWPKVLVFSKKKRNKKQKYSLEESSQGLEIGLRFC